MEADRYASGRRFPEASSLRGRRLEVVGAKKERARESETRESSSHVCSFFRPLIPSACYAGKEAGFWVCG